MDKVNFNGWFGERVVNGVKNLSGMAFFAEEISYPVTVTQDKDSFTLTIESMKYTFAPKITKDTIQRFDNGKQELILKKKTRSSLSYYAFVLHDK